MSFSLVSNDYELKKPKQTRRCLWVFGALLGGCLAGVTQNAFAHENPEENVATTAVPSVETVKLTIHPMPESKPALKIQLLPDPTEQLDGNSAIFYLKAIGFLEQDSARDRLREIYKKSAEQSKETGTSIGDIPPHSYEDMHPRDYPKKEVREYLSLVEFQQLPLREARRMKDFSMNRNIHLSESPIGYLLPEMQSIRAVARNQRVRCRFAIAEDRINDAIEIIGQQVTMSHHLAKDDFLVSYLVGAATLRIALDDAMLAIEHEKCPNLYWAFAQLPDPLLNHERCLAVERQFLFMQIPKLKDVDTTVLPAEYWTVFIQDFAKRTAEIDMYNESEQTTIVSKVQGEKRVQSIHESVKKNAPQAKKYLLNRGVLQAEKIDSYTDEQLVFLAMKDYYQVSRDEHFKWLNLPHRIAKEKIAAASNSIKKDQEQYGWFAGVTNYLLPSIDAVNDVITRARQRIALIQTIEAIRMAGAENGGKLIDTLEKTPVPVPNDPFTNKPFEYKVSGDTAVLSADIPETSPIRIELKFAK